MLTGRRQAQVAGNVWHLYSHTLPPALQGCGQAQAGLVDNWGDGFITDPAVLAAAPGASDPNPFFQSLMGKPYLNQVVIAPHVYPPSITNNLKLPASGPELYMRLSRWGQWSMWWPMQLVLAS